MKKILLLIYAFLIVAATIAQTPVAYYPFSGNANDAVGTLNGTVNGATLTTDRFGNANSAYSFDGVDDFIDIGNLNFATNNYTVSFWVNMNSGATDNTVFSGADPAALTNSFVVAEINNGIGRFLHRNPAGISGGVEVNTVQTFPLSQWKFVTCLKQGTTLQYYLNGILDNSFTDAGLTNISSSIYIELGRLRGGGNTFIRYLHGKLDEVKIYNVALTAAQILTEYNNNPPIPTNALQFWVMGDVGITKDANNKISAWADQSPNSRTATQADVNKQPVWVNNVINGHAVVRFTSVVEDYFRTNYKGPNTGEVTMFVVAQGSNISSVIRFQNEVAASSGFLIYGYTHNGANNGFCMSNDGADVNGINCGFFGNAALQIGTARWKANTTNGMQTFIDGSLLAQRNSNNSILPNDSLGIGSGNGSNSNPDENTIGDVAEIIIYDRALTDAERLQVETYLNIKYRVTNNLATSKPGSGNAINFDGVNDHITIPNVAFNDFTYELWINTTQTGPGAGGQAFAGAGILSGDVGNSTNGDFIPMALNGSVITTGSGDGTDFTLSSTTPVNDGKWHHVAVTREFSTGLRKIYIDGIENASGTSGANISYNLSNTIYVGADFVDQVFYQGALDEIRVWNTALTQSQIRDRMCKKIKSTDPLYTNLIAYYNFDETTGITAFDGTVNANNGTLTNSPTRVTSGAAIGNASAHDYVNTTKTVSLNHPTGENFTVTSTAGAPTGIQTYRVDEQPNTLTGATGVGPNNKYFGVFQVGGTTPQYSAVYNYNGNPLVNATNENTLALFKRTDNAATSWSNGSAALNTTSKTLTLTGQSTEYILGSTGAALPLNLISFTGTKQSNNAVLQWKTANEINVARFEVQRSVNGLQFTTAGTKNAGAVNYLFEDVNAFVTQQKLFYRLKNVDKDGRFSYSGTVLLQAYDAGTITVFPNPVTTTVTVSNLKQNSVVRLVNTAGSVVRQQTVNAQSIIIDMQLLAGGIYVLQYQNNQTGLTETIKIIKQ